MLVVTASGVQHQRRDYVRVVGTVSIIGVWGWLGSGRRGNLGDVGDRRGCRRGWDVFSGEVSGKYGYFVNDKKKEILDRKIL